jgi:hypothetical protein
LLVSGTASQDSRVIVSTYLLPAEAAIVRERAQAADRSVAAEVRRALKPYLEGASRTRQERRHRVPA